MVFRVIARLDVKPPNLVKGIHLEGLRKLGDPSRFADKYYSDGADEISYQDIVASLYGRNSIQELVSKTANHVFIPLSVGGGIRTAEDAVSLIRAGADKISINTAAIHNPALIAQIGNVLGCQAVILGIEAKRTNGSNWTAMTDCGREHSGKDVLHWVQETVDLGVGEIILTSIDQEGTMLGFDLELIEAVRSVTQVPIIAHGGAGTPEDILLAQKAGANGVALASMLHFEKYTISQIKTYLNSVGIEVRR